MRRGMLIELAHGFSCLLSPVSVFSLLAVVRQLVHLR
jgi:hypothetical protein